MQIYHYQQRYKNIIIYKYISFICNREIIITDVYIVIIYEIFNLLLCYFRGGIEVVNGTIIVELLIISTGATIFKVQECPFF